MTWSNSLLDAGEARPVYGAIDWINGVLLGQLAVGLCIIAVAAIGILMLGGRLPIRQGARVILGCFLLLGAPAMMGQFVSELSPGFREMAFLPADPAGAVPRENLQPADYNPYASATMRTD